MIDKTLRGRNRLLSLVISLLLLPVSQLSHAMKIEYDFAGFASFAYGKAYSDSKEGELYVRLPNNLSTEGEYRNMNVFGLRLDADLGNNLTFVSQMVADGLVDYDPEFDWIYANYQISNAWSVAVGKTRTPMYFYSDTLDVGYAYPWISPPNSVYSASLLRSLDGINITYYDNWGDWSQRVQIYAGTDDSGIDGVYSLSITDARGITLTSEYDDWLTLRATYYEQNLDLHSTELNAVFEYGPGPGIGTIGQLGSDIGVDLQAVEDDLVLVDKDREYIAFGIRMEFDQLFIISEIQHEETEDNAIGIGTDGAYLTVGSRLLNKITLAITYAESSEDQGNMETLDTYRQLTGPAFAAAGPPGSPADPLMFARIATWDVTINTLLEQLEKEKQELILSARWDFHHSAALKIEHTRLRNESFSGGESTIKRPYAWTIGVDLVF